MLTRTRSFVLLILLAVASLSAARVLDASTFGEVPQEVVTPVRETPSLLESAPSGWIDIQPASDLAGWTRGSWPPTAPLGSPQWRVDPASGHLVCDGTGGHDWLRYDRELGDVAFHVEWRFTPVAGGDKYNSGVLVRSAPDLSVWHQAQTGDARGGHLFGNTLVDGKVQRVNLASEAASRRVKPAGEWNTYELVARGPVISLWVNGAVTSELTRAEVLRGHVGLEGEGWRIEFRKLKIKRLD